MPLPRKDSPSSSRSRRGAREVCFAQTERGPGPLGKMLSAALALANAVQFSACSRVLSVLGPARAGPSERVFCSRVFCLRVFCQKDLIRSLGRRPDLSQLRGVGNAVYRIPASTGWSKTAVPRRRATVYIGREGATAASLDRARTPRSNGRRERRRRKKKRGLNTAIWRQELGRRVVRHPDLTAFPVGRSTY